MAGRRFRAMLVLGGLAVFGLALPGCAVVHEVKTALFEVRTVNLAETSYGAADMLAQQSRARLTPQTPLRIAMLTDVTTPYEVTAFGQQVANQLGSRFVQLGYNVQSVPLPPALMPELTGGQTAPPPNSPQPVQMGLVPSKGEAMVTGTYMRNRDSIQVSLKILQGSGQNVIAAYDYTLPMTRDLRHASMSEADRIRLASDPFAGTFTE